MIASLRLKIFQCVLVLVECERFAKIVLSKLEKINMEIRNVNALRRCCFNRVNEAKETRINVKVIALSVILLKENERTRNSSGCGFVKQITSHVCFKPGERVSFSSVVGVSARKNTSSIFNCRSSIVRLERNFRDRAKPRTNESFGVAKNSAAGFTSVSRAETGEGEEKILKDANSSTERAVASSIREIV